MHITSINSLRPIVGLMAYSAAKAALTNYSKALSKQVAPLGVPVNTVAPGFIETEGAKGLIEKTASKSGSDLDNASSLSLLPIALRSSPVENT